MNNMGYGGTMPTVLLPKKIEAKLVEFGFKRVKERGFIQDIWRRQI